MSISRRSFLGGGLGAAATVFGNATAPLAALVAGPSPGRAFPRRRRGGSSGALAQQVAAVLDELVPRTLAGESIPGASVVVTSAERSLYSRAFGLKSTSPEEPTSPSTVFEAASLSKPVFAYVVLRMAERGEIDLDRPLGEYLSEPYVADERIEQVTARLVLSHRTGFPNWARNTPLGFMRDPGTRFGYSGEGFVYLQRVVERITGTPLHEVMEQRLFVPLGMTASSYVWRDEYGRSSAVGHGRDGVQTEKRKPDEGNAAASLHTTASDYGSFLRAVFDRGQATSPASSLGDWRLTPAAIDSMLTLETEVNDAVAWGLGWGLEEPVARQTFWHWGDNGPFKAFVFGSRSADLAVVMFTNGAHGLKLAPPVVTALFPGEHPALQFRMIDY